MALEVQAAAPAVMKIVMIVNQLLILLYIYFFSFERS